MDILKNNLFMEWYFYMNFYNDMKALTHGTMCNSNIIIHSNMFKE